MNFQFFRKHGIILYSFHLEFQLLTKRHIFLSMKAICHVEFHLLQQDNNHQNYRSTCLPRLFQTCSRKRNALLFPFPIWLGHLIQDCLAFRGFPVLKFLSWCFSTNQIHSYPKEIFAYRKRFAYLALRSLRALSTVPFSNPSRAMSSLIFKGASPRSFALIMY